MKKYFFVLKHLFAFCITYGTLKRTKNDPIHVTNTLNAVSMAVMHIILSTPVFPQDFATLGAGVGVLLHQAAGNQAATQPTSAGRRRRRAIENALESKRFVLSFFSPQDTEKAAGNIGATSGFISYRRPYSGLSKKKK